MRNNRLLRFLTMTLLCFCSSIQAEPFVTTDIFGLEYASDPQVAPDGERVVYVRASMDIMSDQGRSNLWIIDSNGSNHRAIASSSANFFSPRWSADGNRMAYVSSQEGSVQIYLRWMDSGQVARLTDLTSSPSSLSWSPDGHLIAFTMPVAVEASHGIASRPSNLIAKVVNILGWFEQHKN